MPSFDAAAAGLLSPFLPLWYKMEICGRREIVKWLVL